MHVAASRRREFESGRYLEGALLLDLRLDLLQRLGLLLRAALAALLKLAHIDGLVALQQRLVAAERLEVLLEGLQQREPHSSG